MSAFLLYFVVSVSGACVLAVEIVGTRVLGPFYGVSLFLWSALISVTLAALSAGYALGGRLADRSPRARRLGPLLFFAGGWILLIPLLTRPVLLLTEPFGLRVAVLAATVVLFAPPLTLMGMVSPFAIRLKTASLGQVGRTAGDLYAVSTIASVGAALLTGFVLVPNIGVSRLLVGIGLLLVATSALVFLPGPRQPLGLVLLVVAPLAVCAVPSSWFQPHPAEGSARLVAHKESAYADLRVVDREDLRYLVIDGGVHTVVEPGSWISHFPYVDVVDLAGRFFDQPGNLLLIGLGGGSVAKCYAAEGWKVDAVEIDPAVTSLAHAYFGLDAREAAVHDMDGRRFLHLPGPEYQLIVLDAFGSSSIPFHLVTEEAFGEAAARLANDGILVMNLEAVGWNDMLVRSVAATLATHFGTVLALPLAEPPDRIGNVIMMASRRDLELDGELPLPPGRFSAEYHRKHAWDNRFKPDVRGVPVLTDDLNPVDLWAERINRVARKNLHDFFGNRGVSW